MSKFGQLYQHVYQRLCGRHPNLRPWHFQWLVAQPIYADLRAILPRQTGQVLDIGCGDGPYQPWLSAAERVVGLDIAPGAGVDIVIDPAHPWPLQNATFDTVLCTQVLEHVQDVDLILTEIERVLKPGGVLICTVPFIYNMHGLPHDYRRLSIYGLKALVEARYTILTLKGQGKIGSTVGMLLLNWLEQAMNTNKWTRLLKAFWLPAWLPFCALVNGLGVLWDKVDRTSAYYHNALVVARKCV